MSANMKRRAFITLLGGAAVAWPVAVGAQQPDKLPTVGFLVPNTRSAATEWIDAFVLRMRELGWIEGRTVAIEYRWVEGRGERFAEIAAEFVQLKVNVIVTSGTPAVMALQQATNVIPIVFATAGDPVSTGLVASLARPGGLLRQTFVRARQTMDSESSNAQASFSGRRCAVGAYSIGSSTCRNKRSSRYIAGYNNRNLVLG
jgi:ABC-type uncharacterized transport system substrate-binding protein